MSEVYAYNITVCLHREFSVIICEVKDRGNPSLQRNCFNLFQESS